MRIARPAQLKHEIVIDPRRVDETLLGENVWENEDFPDLEEDPEEDPDEDLQEDDLQENDDDAEPAAGEKGFEIQAVAAFPYGIHKQKRTAGNSLP